MPGRASAPRGAACARGGARASAETPRAHRRGRGAARAGARGRALSPGSAEPRQRRGREGPRPCAAASPRKGGRGGTAAGAAPTGDCLCPQAAEAMCLCPLAFPRSAGVLRWHNAVPGGLGARAWRFFTFVHRGLQTASTPGSSVGDLRAERSRSRAAGGPGLLCRSTAKPSHRLRARPRRQLSADIPKQRLALHAPRAPCAFPIALCCCPSCPVTKPLGGVMDQLVAAQKCVNIRPSSVLSLSLVNKRGEERNGRRFRLVSLFRFCLKSQKCSFFDRNLVLSQGFVPCALAKLQVKYSLVQCAVLTVFSLCSSYSFFNVQLLQSVIRN